MNATATLFRQRSLAPCLETRAVGVPRRRSIPGRLVECASRSRSWSLRLGNEGWSGPYRGGSGRLESRSWRLWRKNRRGPRRSDGSGWLGSRCRRLWLRRWLGRLGEIEVGEFQLDAGKIQLEIMAGEGIVGFLNRLRRPRI